MRSGMLSSSDPDKSDSGVSFVVYDVKSATFGSPSSLYYWDAGVIRPTPASNRAMSAVMLFCTNGCHSTTLDNITLLVLEWLCS